jgi:hypothetical protein
MENSTQIEIENLRKLARSWNNLDTKYIINELSDNIVYESQWVLIPVKGKTVFLEYLVSKFKAIKNTSSGRVKAEMAFLPSLSSKPCIVLSQKTPEVSRKVTVLIKIVESKVERIDVCFIPAPEEAILTGEIPV